MNIQILKRTGLPDLAYVYSPPAPGGGGLPPVMFCGGYRSDMGGTKAMYLEAQCRARGQAYLRFDYSGHGQSSGRFEDLGISDWARDAGDMLRHVFPEGRVLLVGSSMGGWVSLLLARAVPERFCGMVGIAAAPDFTEDMYARLNEAQRAALIDQGFVRIANDYSDEPYYFSRAFYEDAKGHLVLAGPLDLPFGVVLLQGRKDADVPWETAERIRAHMAGTDVRCEYVEDGDHRLSRPQDLALLDAQVRAFSGV